MTINEIKADANTDIRLKTIANSVTRDEVADLIDALADEQRDRGVTIVANTTALATLAGTNYKYAIVTNIGIFEYAASGTPNGTTIFAAVSGVWVAKFLTTDISGKQNTLISGTNIKTVNNQSLLGSINIAVQDPLVSGTNIKTLNSQSLLGSGNISIVTADEIEEFANLAAFPGTGNQEKIYVAVDTQSLYRWTGSVYVQVSGGGGGGSQTLDQVLVSGNTTNEKIIFDDTQANPGINGAVTKEWFVIKPIVKGTDYSSDFAFREAGINFGGVVDHTMIWGWNIGAGGGLELGSVQPYANLAAFPVTGNYNTIYRANDSGLHYNWNNTTYVLGKARGRTGIGFSLEDRYDYAGNGDMKTESHQFYIDALGIQWRISSFEINTSTNEIGHYNVCTSHGLRMPGPVGGPNPDFTYWTVYPGTFANTNFNGQGVQFQTLNQYDYGGLANTTIMTGTNTNRLIIQGYAEIALNNAYLYNFSAGNFNAGSIGLSGNLSATGDLATGGNFTISSGAEYSFMQVQAGNDALAWYGGTLSRLWFYNFTEINFGGAALANFTITGGISAGAFSSGTAYISNNDINGPNLYVRDAGVGYLFQAQAGNAAMQTYSQGGAFRWWLSGVQEITTPNLTRMDFGNKALYIQNSSFGFIHGNGDIVLNLGVDGARMNEVWTKSAMINEIKTQSKAGDPSTTDVPDGKWMMWENTTSGALKLWANQGGTLKSVTLS